MPLDKNYWPSVEAFMDLSGADQWDDGRARCTGVALCNGLGQPAKVFSQGDWAHFFYEFEILGEIGIPSGGMEFHALNGTVIHGKNTFQYDKTPIPEPAIPGTLLRFHQAIKLEVCTGSFEFGVGLAATDAESFQAYRNGTLSHAGLDAKVNEPCRVAKIGTFEVQLRPPGKLMHHGITNLPGECTISVMDAPEARLVLPVIPEEPTTWPTIFHITHWKAGSQWVRMILKKCVPELLVDAQVGEHQFLHWPIRPGKVYPTVYVTRQQFESVRLPLNWRRFVVIRDLRDTLISAYFSMKVSHPVIDPLITRWRLQLQSSSLDDGLIWMIDEWIPACANIQTSWLEANERLIHYEDLLERDLEILEPLLLDDYQLPVSRERFRQIVASNRFEHNTGRVRGEEDVNAHNRKGISGDWQNHFSERVKQAFKMRYGMLLIATGYEKDLNW